MSNRELLVQKYIFVPVRYTDRDRHFDSLIYRLIIQLHKKETLIMKRKFINDKKTLTIIGCSIAAVLFAVSCISADPEPLQDQKTVQLHDVEPERP